MQKKIIYVVSLVHKSLAFEWIASALKNDYKLSFILLNSSNSALEEYLKLNQVEVTRINYAGKKDFIQAFFNLFFIFLKKKPDIVHAHLFDAQLIGLTAAWLLRIKKRVYTRHNSNYHHVYHQQGIRYDRWSNRMATQIISISQATDKTLLQLEQVPHRKVIKIPHGFDLNEFAKVTNDRIIRVLEKWKISNGQFNIGVIARHIEWKGIQYIIPAFQKFLKEDPKARLVLANASGPYHEKIVDLLKSIPTDRFILIPFEEDVAALYSIFDLFVHTPIDPICEAFGQTYVEALAAGVPSLFTLSGIAEEFIVHERNALVVKFKDSDDIYLALMRLSKNTELRIHLVKNGKQDVFSRFGVARMVTSLRKLYEE
jgi:glycosyltransferase involved in cell wall biosynthesis